MTELAEEPQPAIDQQRQPFTFADATCRSAAERMATTGQLRLAVVDRATQRLVGFVSLEDLLLGRRRFVEREESRERVFRLASRRMVSSGVQREPEGSDERESVSQ
jgi:hypothetical protein